MQSGIDINELEQVFGKPNGKLGSIGVIRPKYTVEHVLRDLLAGLEDGTIVPNTEVTSQPDRFVFAQQKVSNALRRRFTITKPKIFVAGGAAVLVSILCWYFLAHSSSSVLRQPRKIEQKEARRNLPVTHSPPNYVPETTTSNPRPESALPSKELAKLETVHQLLKQSWTVKSFRQVPLRKASTILSTVPSETLKPSNPAVREIRNELVAMNEDIQDLPPAYWQIVAQITNYQYVNNIRQFLREGPPPCPVIPNGKLFNAVISNCEINVDGKSFDQVTFSHVLIRYTGGPLDLHDVKFESCHFELSFSTTPTLGGQRLALALLQQGEKATINIG